VIAPGNEKRLACGRPVDGVLAQVADGRGTDRDLHQRHCPYCEAALTEYDRLWGPVRELAAQRITAPDSVLEAALRRILRAVEHIDYGTIESSNGVTRIAARVVVVTARETARTVPGVRVALSRHLSGDAVRAGVVGRSAAIEITMAADHGLDLPRLAEQVRHKVETAIRTLIDLEPVAIAIIIDDVLER
jgi:uncharacterized alkaline shock family protein YloU